MPYFPMCTTIDGSRKSDTSLSGHDPRTAVQLRTALKRLKEIMEGRSQVFTPDMTRPFRTAFNTVLFFFLDVIQYLVDSVIDRL